MHLSLARSWSSALLVLVIAAPMPAAGQAPMGPSPKKAQAVRLTGSVDIDGRLDEAIWASAPAISDFVLKEPVQGGEPGDRTEIRFAYDDHALYVGLRMFSRDPDAIPRDITRRDQYGNSEHVTVSLDPYLDRRTAVSFGITAGGVRRDYYHNQDSEDFMARDFTFDPVWEARAQVDAEGWTAEMRIPFSQLRFTDKPVQVWGLNVNRWVPQHNEDSFWVMVPRDETGFASRFGTLEGLDGIRPARRLEAVPYLAGNANFTAEPATSDPFNDGSTGDLRIGGDVKMGLGPSLTLDATFNPDFGQVEADPATLNLTAFETIFPERRPFFTDGNPSLLGPVVNYYYSRRVGAAPRGSASADFVDSPDNTTILGAARLTGRLGSKLTIGAQAAVTQREFARTYDLQANQFGEVEVEPTATYGVLRLQQQFGESQSTIGLSLAGMNRYFSSGSPLESSLSNRSAAGGVDWLVRFQGGRYVLSGHAGFSYVGGDSTAIEAIQRSSAHYLQRPDFEAMRLDPSRTALWGVTGRIRADKNTGNWRWGAEVRTESPGFEANDMGRVQNADDFDFEGDINYRETDPGPVFRRWNVGIFGRSNVTYDWERGDSRLAVFATGQFANFWEFRTNLAVRPRSQDHNLTRGGPLMGQLALGGGEFSLNSNWADPTSWSLRGEFGWGEGDLALQSVGGSLQVRPATALAFSVGPSYSRVVDPQQYFTTLSGGYEATYGSRYIFAQVEQTVLSMQLRLNYTFNPDLTIELYAEPFSASGRFTNHGELPAPRAFDQRTYGTDGTTITKVSDQEYRVSDSRNGGTFSLPVADFNDFSFRSNFVLRWEWTRGSTFYLVWQQNRYTQCSFFSVASECPTDAIPGTPTRPGFMGSALSVPGDNFFAVKISYWLAL
jgi:hypothetical protein